MRYRTNSTLWDPFIYNISRNEFENKYLMMIDNLAILHDLSNDLSCKSYNRTNKMMHLESLLKNTELSINKIISELEGQI